MPDLKLTIKAVARMTGLSPHVIRTWEKRYGTVNPIRSGGNQRLYSSADVEKLQWLKQATEAGHSIGTVAQLPVERLRRLMESEATSRTNVPSPTSLGSARMEAPVGDASEAVSGYKTTPSSVSFPVEAGEFLAPAMEAVARMDSASLENLLERASMALGQMRLLNEVVVPLVESIGSAWERGELKVSQEHMATAVLRTFLGNIARPMALHPRAPAILISTPAGQLHELGAILAAAVASGLGWKVIYCGPSLPAEEIASAALQNSVRAVGLSIVHPADDPTLGLELLRLRRLLPADTAVVVGGRSAAAYQPQIETSGGIRVGSLEEFSQVLTRLRQGPRVP